jgi:8-oxo-dGTP pyrophosphatase MutT (NUDIX family)
MPMIARVRPGQGLGAPRMAEPGVMELLERTMGFRPVPGTLNVLLEHSFERPAGTEYVAAGRLSHDWAAATGQAGYWLIPILVGGRYEAMAVQADEPGYPPEQLELVCDVRLRDALDLADGDPVELIVLPRPADDARWIAGAVIHDGSGRVFLQRRSADRDLFPGAWDIVGGHLEPGEGLIQALRREVAEETGWRLRRVVDDLGLTTYAGEDDAERHEADYLVEVDGDLAAPRIEEHLHLDPRWVERSGAMALLDGTHRSDALLRPVIERAFELLARAAR